MGNNLNQVNKTILVGEQQKRALKGKDGEIIKYKGENVEFSRLDLRHLANLPEKEIFKTINRDLELDINTPEGLEKFNLCFRDSLNLYHNSVLERLFKHKGVDISQIQEYFSSKEEILEFIKATGEGTVEASLRCLLIKISSSVADILNNEYTAEQDKIKDGIIENLQKFGSMEEDVGGKKVGRMCGKKVVLHWRSKSKYSMVNKTMGNIKYNTVDSISDRQGLTFEVDEANFTDGIKVMGAIDILVNSMGGKIIEKKTKYGKFENDLASSDEINNNLQLSDLCQGVKSEKKKGTSEKYVEWIKVTYNIGGVNIEIRVVPHGKENQEGLEFSGIYDTFQKWIEGYGIRHINEGYITKEEIEIIVDYFFETLQELLDNNPWRKGTKKEDYMEELWNALIKGKFIKSKLKYRKKSGPINSGVEQMLKDGLTNYYINRLIPTGSNANKFTSVRGESLIESGFFEEEKELLKVV